MKGIGAILFVLGISGMAEAVTGQGSLLASSFVVVIGITCFCIKEKS